MGNWIVFISLPCELCKQTLTLYMTHDLYKTIVTLPLTRARTHTHELYCTTVATCNPDCIGMLPWSASSCFGCLYEQQIEILVCHSLSPWQTKIASRHFLGGRSLKPPAVPQGRVGYFSNERGFSVDSSLVGI